MGLNFGDLYIILDAYQVLKFFIRGIDAGSLLLCFYTAERVKFVSFLVYVGA